jgi:hypothetical protein
VKLASNTPLLYNRSKTMFNFIVFQILSSESYTVIACWSYMYNIHCDHLLITQYMYNPVTFKYMSLVYKVKHMVIVRLKVFDATFNNISAILWRSDLFVEKTRETHRPAASRWQTLPFQSTWVHPRLLVGFVLLDL